MATYAEAILNQLRQLAEYIRNDLSPRIDQMAVDLANLTTQVERNTSLQASTEALLKGLAQQVADLKGASTDPETQQKIDALVTQLQSANTAEEAAQAIIANTPAEDVPVDETGGGGEPAPTPPSA